MNEEEWSLLQEKNTQDYVNMCSKFLCTKLGCYWLYQDIKQDFYIAIMEISLKKPDHPDRYILREAKLAVWDILRSKKYKERYGAGQFRRPRDVQWPDLWSVSDPSCPTDTEICDNATLDSIPLIVSERQSDALQANKVERWSQEDIAQRYGVSRSMISKDMKAAVQKLQEQWQVTPATTGRP